MQAVAWYSFLDAASWCYLAHNLRQSEHLTVIILLAQTTAIFEYHVRSAGYFSKDGFAESYQIDEFCWIPV